MIILDFKFAILDRRADRRQRRLADPLRRAESSVVGISRKRTQRTQKEQFPSCVLCVLLRPFCSLRAVRPVLLGLPPLARVKVVLMKSRTRKPLMVNVFKPCQTKSNQLAPKFAGLGTDQSWPQVNSTGELCEFKFSRCQLLSDNVTYGHVWSHIRRKLFVALRKL